MTKTDLKYDVVGDVHGCFEELLELMNTLGYLEDGSHPEGRVLAFVGDLVDKGPYSPEVLDFVMILVKKGFAVMVQGNHDEKLGRVLAGNKVEVSQDIQNTLDALKARGKHTTEEYVEFLRGLPLSVSLANGALTLVHASLPPEGSSKSKARSLCLYGPVVNGERDREGYPVRIDWTQEYNASEANSFVVFGHVMHEKVYLTNKTACVDTGCVSGGKLSALRFPEKEVVSVPSKQPVTRKLLGYVPA